MAGITNLMPWQDDRLARGEAEQLDEAARLYGPGEANRRDLFFRVRRDAHRRGLVFTLTMDEFSTLIGQPCFWTGRKPALRHHRRGGANEAGYEREAVAEAVDRTCLIGEVLDAGEKVFNAGFGEWLRLHGPLAIGENLWVYWVYESAR